MYAKWGNNCHCYSSVVHLEFSALSSFFSTGSSAIEKLFIIIIIILLLLLKGGGLGDGTVIKM